MKKKNERAVLVTTEYRGVFFGYTENTDGDTVTLYRARNCVYWGSDVKGFLGLAANGPTSSCRIGPTAAKLELRKVTSVSDVNDSAVEKWEKAPWN